MTIRDKRNKLYKNEALKPFLNIKSEFKAEVNGEEATLYIYGDIGDSWFGESVSASDVKEFLDSTTAQIIHVNINSLGGDMFDSLAIHNQLKRHDAKIIINIDGIAASGASVIAMAGDQVNMPNTSMLMIHNAWTFAFGNAIDFRKAADDLDKIGETLIESYLSRFTGSREELIQLLDDESFLTAAESVVFGLADAELEEVEEEKPKEPVKISLFAKYAANAATPKRQEESNESVSEEPQNILSRFKRPVQA